MHLHTPAFYLGVQEELEKFARCWEGYEPVPGKEPYSEDSCRPKGDKKKDTEKKAATDMGSMPVNENILPSITNQARWKYVRTKDGLRLSDGNLMYSFGLPSEYPKEDTRISRLADDNILNFENDALSKGTAQIHRSSPDNVYMTLADGSQNPTFMLQHEEGKNWRYSPSKKFLAKLNAVKASLPREESSERPEEIKSRTDSTLIDPESFMLGAKEAMLSLDMDSDELAGAIKNIGGGMGDVIAGIPSHPGTTMLAGAMTGMGVNALRRKIDPSLELREKTDPRERRKRILYPAAAAALPLIAGGMLNHNQSHA